MLAQLYFSLLVLLLSLISIVWYYIKYKPQKIINNLRAQGVQEAVLETNPRDDFFYLKKAIQENPNVKAFVKKLSRKIVLSFVDPNLVKQVLTNHTYYSKLHKNSELNQRLSTQGMTHVEGKRWKLHRIVLSEAFQFSFFQEMIPTIIKTADEVLGLSSNKPKVIKFPLQSEIITSNIVTSIFFGVSVNIDINGVNAVEELTYCFDKLMKYNMSPIRFFPGMWALNFSKDYRELKKRLVNFRAFFKSKIQERMQEIKKNAQENPTVQRKTDLLEILLRHRLKNHDDPEKTLSDDEILDNFFTFFVAGKDTTSTLITMSLYYYSTYPDWGAKLKKEIIETINKPEDITVDLVNSMPFLQAYLNEVLRFSSPAPLLLARTANHDHFVGDIFVQKGTIVNIAFVAMGYNPKYFDNPEQFDPTRWLSSDTRQEGWKSNPFAFVPFSGGPRNCIGKHLALLEAKVILCLLFKHFDVEIDPEYKPNMANLGVVYLPSNQMPVTLIPKQ